MQCLELQCISHQHATIPIRPETWLTTLHLICVVLYPVLVVILFLLCLFSFPKCSAKQHMNRPSACDEHMCIPCVPWYSRANAIGFATAFIKVDAFILVQLFMDAIQIWWSPFQKLDVDNDCSRRRSVQVWCIWNRRAQVGCGTFRPTSMQKTKADDRGREGPTKEDARKKKGTAKANARGRRGPADAEKIHCVSRTAVSGVGIPYVTLYVLYAVPVYVDLSLRIPLMFLCCDMPVSSDSTVSYKQPCCTTIIRWSGGKMAPCLTCLVWPAKPVCLRLHVT